MATSKEPKAVVTFSGLTINIPEDSFLEYLSEWSGISVERLRDMAVQEVEYLDNDISFILESM